MWGIKTTTITVRNDSQLHERKHSNQRKRWEEKIHIFLTVEQYQETMKTVKIPTQIIIHFTCQAGRRKTTTNKWKKIYETRREEKKKWEYVYKE